MREYEAERLWGYFGYEEKVSHLRLSFYKVRSLSLALSPSLSLSLSLSVCLSLCLPSTNCLGSFYKGEYFTNEPKLTDDVIPILKLIQKEKPDVVSLAFGPEGSGPDTHYKVRR